MMIRVQSWTSVAGRNPLLTPRHSSKAFSEPHSNRTWWKLNAKISCNSVCNLKLWSLADCLLLCLPLCWRLVCVFIIISMFCPTGDALLRSCAWVVTFSSAVVCVYFFWCLQMFTSLKKCPTSCITGRSP